MNMDAIFKKIHTDQGMDVDGNTLSDADSDNGECIPGLGATRLHAKNSTEFRGTDAPERLPSLRGPIPSRSLLLNLRISSGISEFLGSLHKFLGNSEAQQRRIPNIPENSEKFRLPRPPSLFFLFRGIPSVTSNPSSAQPW